MTVKAPKVLKTLNNPPKLAINTILYGTGPGCYGNGEMPPHVRLEQRIAWNLFQHISLAGFEPVSVDSGDEVTCTKTWKHVMELIFNLDDAYVSVQHKTKLIDDAPTSHYIRFVFGNDNCINDWSYATNDEDAFNATMEKFDAGVYA